MKTKTKHKNKMSFTFGSESVKAHVVYWMCEHVKWTDRESKRGF